MHRHKLAAANNPVNVRDSERHQEENVFTIGLHNGYQITKLTDLRQKGLRQQFHHKRTGFLKLCTVSQ